MRISDWSSDVCSSDLRIAARLGDHALQHLLRIHLPAIIEDAEQDQQKDRRGQREFDERGAALAATQPAEQGTDAGHCDSLSLEICRAIAWNCSLSSAALSASNACPDEAQLLRLPSLPPPKDTTPIVLPRWRAARQIAQSGC